MFFFANKQRENPIYYTLPKYFTVLSYSRSFVKDTFKNVRPIVPGYVPSVTPFTRCQIKISRFKILTADVRHAHMLFHEVDMYMI